MENWKNEPIGATLLDELKSINEKVVTIKSQRWGDRSARFINGDSKLLTTSEATQSKLKDSTNLHFKIHVLDLNLGVVCIESIKFPDHYIDVNTKKGIGDRHIVQLTKSNTVPRDSKWAHLCMYGGSIKDIILYSGRYDNRVLDAHPSFRLFATRSSIYGPESEKWAAFTIALLPQ